jgi:hypothetical protein
MYAGGGGIGSSEDADDDYDGTDSPSSGSLTFSPKRSRLFATGLRQRISVDKAAQSKGLGQGLGLSFEPESTEDRGTETEIQLDSAAQDALTSESSRKMKFKSKMREREDTGDGGRSSSLFSLRLLAIFPAVWGTLVLLRAFVAGGTWQDVYPWGFDTSREALDRLITGGTYEGTWKEVSRGDMLLSIAWVRQSSPSVVGFSSRADPPVVHPSSRGISSRS